MEPAGHFRREDTEIFVYAGGIERVRAHVLVVTIDTDISFERGEIWNGPVDEVIRLCAGDMFHAQAEEYLSYIKGSHSFLARRRGNHFGRWDNVLFQSQSRPLHTIVSSALMEAVEYGNASVCLAAVGANSAQEIADLRPDDIVNGTIQGLTAFLERTPGAHLDTISIVFPNQPDVVSQLVTALHYVADPVQDHAC